MIFDRLRSRRGDPPQRALPPLPTEIWERCMDWLVEGYTSISRNSYGDNINLRRDLRSCALVCSAWRIRAQTHLFVFLRISGNGLSQYEALVLKHPALCDVAKQLKFFNSYVGDSSGGIIDKTVDTASHAVRIAHKLPNIHYFVVDNINMAVEHPHFPRYIAALTTISRLDLYSRTPTKLSHLARALVGLRNLSTILLNIPIISTSTPAPLPSYYYTSKSVLTKLVLIIQPGGNLLLEWLVQVHSFTASLQALGVKLTEHIPESEIIPVMRNLQSVLHKCTGNLKELQFYAKTATDNAPSLYTPTGERISQLSSTVPTSIYPFSVSLAPNNSLSRLELRLSKTWFEQTLGYLKSVTSKCIDEIVCLYWLDEEERPCDDLWRQLDDILSTDVFKSLLKLEVDCAYTIYKGADIEWHYITSFRSELRALMPKAFEKGVIEL